MIVDHVGYYFFRDIEWFRVVGRMSVPIWFFLIGYARSRDMSPRLWWGALILLVANFVSGMALMPLNILFSILITRFSIDFVAKRTLKNLEMFVYGMVVIVMFAVPTIFLWEYGTLGILLALTGYMARNQDSLGIKPAQYPILFGFCILFFGFSQIVMFGFPTIQNQVMFIGIGLVGVLLYHFKRKKHTALTHRLPGFAVSALKLCGRHSFEVYVAHLLVFKLIGVTFGFEGFSLFALRLFAP